MALVVRTDLDPASLGGNIRAAVKSVDPSALVYGIVPMTDLVSSALAQERFNAVVMSVFALLGITLAVVGIYGVVAFSVSRRTRPSEISRSMTTSGVNLAPVGQT